MAWWIFQHVASTAALAAGVVIACKVVRFGPVARHALWVLVLVKFVMPPLVVWPWAAPDPLGIAAFDSRADDAAAALMHSDRKMTTPAMAGIFWSTPADVPPADDAPNPATPIAGGQARPWLLGLWAAGSLFVLGLEGVRIARLAHRVRTAGAAHPAIVSRVAALSARLGLPPVSVVSVAGGASPAVWCLSRPRLLWPEDMPADLTDACIDGVVVHELAHVKRRDHLVGWIELVAGVVWWWNPLFWLVRSARREQAELACDAWVISALPNGRRAYAESLLALSAAAACRGSAPSIAIGIRAGSRRVLERRLVMIMKGHAPLRLPIAGLSTLLVMAAATLPAWATGSHQQQQPPPPTRAVVAVPSQATPAQAAPPPSAPTPARATRVPAAAQQTPPPARPTVAAPHARVAVPRSLTVYIDRSAELPAEGQQLLQGFEADRDAIQQEADKKIDARREALLKALQDLQDQLAKAGKLDEAVAIRDYLRAGGPGGNVRYGLRRKGAR